jgi:hypothetical protein
VAVDANDGAQKLGSELQIASTKLKGDVYFNGTRYSRRVLIS